MILPHPDRSLPSPWAEWPEGVPLPAAAVRCIEQVDDETRDVYRVTMPNGATAGQWTLANFWDGDPEHAWTGDWNEYGLAVNKEHGYLDGPGSRRIAECIEQWSRQDRGEPCETCRCSGRVVTNYASRVAEQAAGLPWNPVSEWGPCPSCLGMGWTPHVPTP